jgi:hypothetical protein
MPAPRADGDDGRDHHDDLELLRCAALAEPAQFALILRHLPAERGEWNVAADLVFPVPPRDFEDDCGRLGGILQWHHDFQIRGAARQE